MVSSSCKMRKRGPKEKHHAGSCAATVPRGTMCHVCRSKVLPQRGSLIGPSLNTVDKASPRARRSLRTLTPKRKDPRTSQVTYQQQTQGDRVQAVTTRQVSIQNTSRRWGLFIISTLAFYLTQDMHPPIHPRTNLPSSRWRTWPRPWANPLLALSLSTV